MKLPRPYIPLRIRVQVAERQAIERFGWINETLKARLSSKEWLKFLLDHLFPNQKVELHHRPALCNRQWFYCDNKPAFCDPDANDPDYLIYLPKDEHDIETRVRGQHGQHSDQALLRISKRKAKRIVERQDKWEHPSKFKWSKRPFSTNYSLPAKKRKWPKRRFQNAKTTKRKTRRSLSRYLRAKIEGA